MRDRHRARQRAGPTFGRSLERRALAVAIAAQLAGTILVLQPRALSGFDLPKAAWTYALTAVLAAILGVSLVRYGPAVLPPGRLHLAAAGVLGTAALAAAFAVHPYTALFGELNRYLGLTHLLAMLVLYGAVAVAIRQVPDAGPSEPARPIAWTLVGTAAIVVLYGALQALGRDPFDWGPGPRVRPISTFGNPDMLGHFLGVAASAGLAVAALAREERVRWIAGAVAAAAAGLLLVVATRGAVLGIAAGGVAFLAVLARLGRLPSTRAMGAGALALLAVAAVVVVSPLGARLANLAAGSETTERIVIWRGALAAFLERPLLGFGPDSLAVAYPRVREPGTVPVHQGAFLPDQAHDWILQSLATTGVMGTAALVAFVALTVLALWRALPRHPAFAGTLLVAAAAYWAQALVAVESVTVSWIPWAIGGAAAALDGTPLVLPRVRRASAVAPVAALIAAIVVAGQLPLLQANAAAWSSRGAVARRDAPAAVAFASEALAADGGRGEHWNLRGIGHHVGKQYAAAAADYEEAWRRVPHQATYLVNLALARLAQARAGDASGGGAAAAYDAARRAIAVDPNLPTPHVALAQVAAAFDDQALALDEAVAAIRLDPTSSAADTLAADAARKLSDPTRAAALLEDALAMRNSPVLREALAALRR